MYSELLPRGTSSFTWITTSNNVFSATRRNSVGTTMVLKQIGDHLFSFEPAVIYLTRSTGQEVRSQQVKRLPEDVSATDIDATVSHVADGCCNTRPLAIEESPHPDLPFYRESSSLPMRTGHILNSLRTATTRPTKANKILISWSEMNDPHIFQIRTFTTFREIGLEFWST